MKKITKALLFFIVSTSSSLLFSQATFDSNGTGGGAWNLAASWTLTAGTDGDGVPDIDDDVTILDGDAISVSGGVDGSVNSVTINADGNLIDFSALTIATGRTLTVASDITFVSINSGTPELYVNGSGNLLIGGSFNVDVPSTQSFASGSTVDYNGTGTQTIFAAQYGILRSSSTGNRVLESSGTIIIKRAAANCFQPGTNSYTNTGSTIEFSASGSQTIPVFNYNNLSIGATGLKTLASGTIGVRGTLSCQGTSNSYSTTGNTINFNGTAAQTISFGGRTIATLNDITFNNSHPNGATLSEAIDATIVAGSITVQTGIFSNGGLTIVGNGGRTLQVNGGATLRLAGTTSFPTGYGTYTLQSNSTVDYNGSGAQTIAARAYSNLTSSNSGGRTLASGTIDISGTYTLTNSSSNYTVTGNTINFNGGSAQVIPMSSSSVTLYNNITINNASGATLGALVNTTNVAGNITVQTGIFSNGGFAITGNGGAAFQVNNGATFTLTGTSVFPTGFGTTTLQTTSSTVNYAGAAQTISGSPTYQNLTVSGSGTKTIGAALDVNGTLTISAGTLDLSGFQTNLAGNLVNNATLTSSSNTVLFDGTSVMSGSGTTTFNDLSVNASNSLTFATSTIAGTTTLGNGSTVNLGTGTITLSASSATWTDNGATVTPSTSTQNFSGNGTHTISSGAQFGTLTFSGTITAPALIRVAGDFNNNGTFTYGTGTVEFNGTATQAIGGSAGTLSFYNMSATTNIHTVNMANNCDLINRLSVTGGATFDADGTGNNRVFTLKSSGQQYAPVGTTAMVGDLSNGTVTGSITMERYINGYTGWRQLACPIQSQTIANWDDEIITTGFTGSDYPSFGGFVSIQQYDPATTSFTPATNTTDNISADAVTNFRGFNVYVGNTSPGTVMSPSITLLNTGTIVSGNKSVTVSGSGDGYNLIQNPFPSAIDFDNLTRTNVDNQFFIFDNYTGNYDDWDGATSTGGHIVNGIIANGQAFWVHATSAGSVGIDENDKISSGTDASFLKTVATSTYEFIRMKATTTATPFSDAIIVGLSNDFSNNYVTGEDADKFTSPYPTAPTLSSLAGNIDVAKNKMAISTTMAIPVRLKVGVSGTYTLTADEITIQGACITLEDKVTNTFTDLRTSAYTFTISDTTAAPRFVLHINNVINNVATTAINTSCSNSNDGLLIASPTGTSGNATFNYTWKDKNNSVLKSSLNKAGADSLAGLPAGDYTVTISQYGSTCGSDYTVALQIAQPGAVNAAFVADNSSVDKGVAVNFTNNSSNAVNYAWNFGDGSAVDNNPNPSHTYTTVGTYTVTLTASDACGTLNSTNTVITVNSPLGINALAANGPINITIYNNVITTVFDFNQINNSTIEVFDILGNLITSKFVEISKGTDQITLPEVSTGIYLVKVSSAEKSLTKKLYLHK